MSILVVDDNPMNIMVVREMLGRSGYGDVQTADSVEEMFRLLNAEALASGASGKVSVDLILLDLMMPAIDGIQGCRLLQQDERYRDIPIIMVTAIGDSLKLAEALDAGANDYVTKPINKVELLARIRSALRLKGEIDWHKEQASRMREELDLARQVQAAVLPSDLDEDRFRLRAYYRASDQLAGDLYAWHVFDGHRMIVTVTDAMGHGIPSSLIAMLTATVLKEAMREMVSPLLVMDELNRRLCQLRYENELVHHYCTGICALIDLERGEMEYVNAGHPPGIVFRAGGEIEEMGTTGSPVGLFEPATLRAERMSLHPGDSVCFYTDGLLDQFEGELEDKLAAMARSVAAADGRDEALQELIERPSLDRRPDDRCMIRLELKSSDLHNGGAE